VLKAELERVSRIHDLRLAAVVTERDEALARVGQLTSVVASLEEQIAATHTVSPGFLAISILLIRSAARC
jgi:hypothetical protein